MSQKPRLVIAGASGFLGHFVLSQISEKYEIKALCRHIPKHADQQSNNNVEWVKCDLFNLKQTEEAFLDGDYLLYLVHSMTKGNRFSQSRFEDLDVIIADNVSRAAKKNNLKQIVFVTGIMPDKEEHLSRHLKSRKEVETVLNLSGVPVTSIRSGVIIGAGGSSFQIVYRLVKRLNFMLTPKWTRSESQPIDVRDVIEFILKSIGNREFFNQKIDVRGSETISYIDLMKKFAFIMNLKRLIITIPFFTLGLSKWWLHLISEMDYDLVSPLVDTLRYSLSAKKSELFEKYIPHPIPLADSIRYWIGVEEKQIPHKKSEQEFEKDVRSVQRLALPEGWNAIDVSEEYVKWLPKLFFSLINIRVSKEHQVTIHFQFFGLRLLTLVFSEDRSSPDRQLFYITGGLLVASHPSANARLEFRMCPLENCILVAVHDYKPSLPWYLYRLFQANIHFMVMFLFGRHLEKKGRFWCNK